MTSDVKLSKVPCIRSVPSSRRGIAEVHEQRTGKFMAERLQRYWQEKLRAETQLLEKLRLKNATLRQARAKLDSQLKRKEEHGLHPR